VDRTAALILVVSITAGCAHSGARATRYGVKPCPPGVALLSADALQCWFDAPRGHWRTLSTESHFDVLVVHVEAFDIRDGEDIGKRFVDAYNATFSEILIYVQPEQRNAPVTRRVRWTRSGGLSTFDFSETR
jgi:hypothetical protein